MGTPWDPSYDHFCVLCQTLKFPILNILKHMRSTNPGRYLIFFLVRIPVECRQNRVWGLIFEPSYEHFYKGDHFGNKCIYIYDGREKGKGKREGQKGIFIAIYNIFATL